MFKKKFFTHILFLGGAVLLAVLASGCFFSAPTGALVTPEIRAIGLPDASVVGSVTLKVTGPGMDTVEVSYSSVPSVINLAIPEGNDRTFELTVGLSPAFTALPTTTYTSFKGTATADITSDSAVVTLNMGIGSTKIVVPDAWNYRLVQIDDMNGTRWRELKGSNMAAFSLTDSNFKPYDVDFDEYGNIYVANYDSTYGGVWRFTSITDTTPVRVLPLSYMTAVAVDRKNGRIYGIDGSANVHYINYDGISGSGSVSSTIDIINGITVDDSGNLYLSGLDYSDQNFEIRIEKYLYNGLTAVDQLTLGSVGVDVSGGDCVVYKGNLCVTADDNKVYRFDPLDLGNGGTLTKLSDVPVVTGSFHKPSIFLATMNDHLTFANDDIDLWSIVSVNGIDGSGYKDFGSSGSGLGEFKFFGNNFYAGGM